MAGEIKTSSCDFPEKPAITPDYFLVPLAGLGVAVLFIGLSVRIIISFLAVFRLGLNMKEKLFIPLAWLPKATVQVSMGKLLQEPQLLLCAVYRLKNI